MDLVGKIFLTKSHLHTKVILYNNYVWLLTWPIIFLPCTQMVNEFPFTSFTTPYKTIPISNTYTLHPIWLRVLPLALAYNTYPMFSICSLTFYNQLFLLHSLIENIVYSVWQASFPGYCKNNPLSTAHYNTKIHKLIGFWLYRCW